jgi:hypothetical protein
VAQTPSARSEFLVVFICLYKPYLNIVDFFIKLAKDSGDKFVFSINFRIWLSKGGQKS